jgi:hypothetical protein
MTGNLPADRRHTRRPRIIDGQEALQLYPTRHHHRIGTGLLPGRSASQVHAHG